MQSTAIENDGLSLTLVLRENSPMPEKITRLGWVQGLTLDVRHPVTLDLPGPAETPFRHYAHASQKAADLTLHLVCLDSKQAQDACAVARSLSLTEPDSIPRRVDNGLFFADLRIGCIPLLVRRDARQVTAYLLSDAPSEHRLAALRLVRNAFVHLARDLRNAVHMHASAATLAGDTVLFCGPRMAGKTTLLMSALARGYDLIGNDDCLVFADGTVAGVPTAIGIRGGTLQRFAALSPLRSQSGRNVHRPLENDETDRRTLPASDVCLLMGRRMVPSASLTTVIVLEPDAACNTAQLTPLSERLVRPRLEAERHPTVSDHQPWWQTSPALAAWPDGDWTVLRARYAHHHLPAVADMVL